MDRNTEIERHARQARGTLNFLRLEFRDLLTPVWAPLAAPLIGSTGDGDTAVFELRLYEWIVRLELRTTAHPSDVPVLLAASVRPIGPLQRAAGMLARPLDGGWRPVVRLPMTGGSARQAEVALYAVREALLGEAPIRRRISQIAA
jgi:hypothetical protein